ncbi:PDZ domain-containing protein [Apilactobacillus sp. TMW 2.2459]|uniref:PDZ domain-containing protein n=1 Tax=Apilactobacillus xinyiensis TaxID=2841032 RepID=UPI00200C72FE|nr:PDZ domain-containing protein [Apilactobacillus xinyiensis]MCL0312660.1 PDZ domain-containing protein [Apilactobacillus xinyiensis]
MNILIAFLIFFCQPVLWIGMFRNYLNYRKRIDRERDLFTTAIYRSNNEFRHFIVSFLLLGVISSVVSILIGMMLPINFIVIYEILLLLNLVLIPTHIMPVFIAFLSAIGYLIIGNVYYINQYTNLDLNMSAFANQNLLVFITIILFLSGIYYKLFGGRMNSPQMYYNQRNTRKVFYIFKELTVIPMLILIPGNLVSSIPYWPVFNFEHTAFSFLFLPVVLGLKFKFFNHIPKDYLHKLGNVILKFSAVSLLVTGISYYFNFIVLYSLCALALIFLLIMLVFRTKDNKKTTPFAEAVNGIRVVAVEKDTPASRMDISIGDIITEVNDIPVKSESEFYQAVLQYPTYCRVKLTTPDNVIKLTETAIYNDSPHELGIVMFKKV